MSSEIGLIVMPTPCRWRKAASGAPLCEVWFGIAGVASPGHAHQGFPMNPGELSASPLHIWVFGDAHPKGTRSPGGEGCPREKRTTLKRSLLLPRETAGAGTGRRAVLRFHSTAEGGEPQGSRKGRPRYPLEGRGEQVDASTQRHMTETQNSGTHVQWN
jgi:hypothetical protein